MKTARRNHDASRGQILIIVALSFAVIFAVTALAVDTGLLVDTQRQQQSVSDAAALAAARDLTVAVSCPSETQAANAAYKSLGLSFPGGWTAPLITTGGCSSGGYGVDFTTTQGNYKVDFSTPPQTPKNPNISADNHGYNYAEVDIHQVASNSFASFIGQPTTTVGTHSIAYDSGPPGPVPWAFYASTYALSGNFAEPIYGDAYVGYGYIGQSGGSGLGQDAMCVYDNPPIGSNDTTKGGHVVFNSPPPASNPTGFSNQDTYNWPNGGFPSPSNCAPGSPVERIFQQKDSAGANLATTWTPSATDATPNGTGGEPCPNGATWSPAYGFCTLPASPPTVSQPTGPTIFNSTSTPTAYNALNCGGGGPVGSLTAGVYVVPASCNVTLANSKTFRCVSFILTNGTAPSPTAIGLGKDDAITSYGDPTGAAGGTACGGSANATNTTAVWADSTSSFVAIYNTAAGNQNLKIDGSIYMPGPPSPATSSPGTVAPTSNCGGLQNYNMGGGLVFGGTVCMATNAGLTVTGSVTVNWWNVQSGNTNPTSVYYSVSNVPPLQESYRLVE